jgi:Tfp pilus assembly protein PilF
MKAARAKHAPAPQAVPPARLERYAPALLLLLGVAAYWNSFPAPFLFDDRYHIVENARIRDLGAWRDLLTHSSRPLIHLSLAFNYALGALNPWGYHAFNLAIHVLAAIVLWEILKRSGASGRVAIATAAIWAVHPLQTESVTYVIQRGESMMGLFYLLTLYCVIRGWKAGAVAASLAAVSCKGVALTAPLVVLLYDRAFLSESWRDLFRRRKGLYAALAATLLIYPLLLSQATAEWKESAGFDYGGVSPAVYAMTQPAVILHYLRLSVWPSGLCLDYGWPPAHSWGEAFLPTLAILGLLAVTVWAWRRHRAIGFLGAFFFLVLAPTSSFLPIADIAVEHRMYLPLAAVVALAVATVARYSGATLPVCAGVVAILTAVTIDRNADYASALTMWRETVRVRPGNPRAQYDLGQSLETAGQTDAAVARYRAALQLKPDYYDALHNLGHLLAKSGNPVEGQVFLEKALRLKPNSVITLTNLGYAVAQQGRPQDAARQFETALRIDPDYPDANDNLAVAYAMLGREADALPLWERALRADPNRASAERNLAYALSQLGRTRDSIQHYDRALRLAPDDPTTLVNYARVLIAMDPERAVGLAERAAQLTRRSDPVVMDVLARATAAARAR